MDENIMEDKKHGSLKLDGTLSIYDVAAVKERLVKSLQDTEVLEIDIGGVMECDTSGLQLLCSAKKTAEIEGKRIILSGITDPVRNAMLKSGITREMIAQEGEEECQR